MFQCYSLKSSHPHLLPLSPKVCSLHLCLLCRPACGIVVTIFLVVQLLSHIRLFVMPWTVACQTFLSFAMSWSLLKLMSIESVMPSNHLVHCHPLLLLPSVFPSIGVFSNESVLRIRWPKYWCFSFSIGPSNEYSGLISFRIDWLDLLAVQGTPKSLLQFQGSVSVIQYINEPCNK